MIALNLLTIFTLFLSSDCYIVDPGPTVIATRGEVWPKPQYQEKFDSYFILQSLKFEFKVITGNECSLLEDAFSRYNRIILDLYQKAKQSFSLGNYLQDKLRRVNDVNYLGYLNTLNVSLYGPCESNAYPSFDMDERYSLTINSGTVELSSNSTWGILRGLETFSQLLYLEDTLSLKINSTVIVDYPRFPHRGLLLDTSRHFIPLDRLLLTLDAMAYNKLNVFHWHIVDDQSFPYVSQKFPQLSAKGAYAPSLVYSPSDVKQVIEYARLRGIRVLPEFDTPGHTRSWGESNRELLTECYQNGVKTGHLGPIDPTKNSTYSFLRDLFQEIGEVFPDKYIHLGGDEVGFECWQSNPDINKFMEINNMTGDYESLESYYIQKLIDIVDQLNSSTIVWEEVFQNNVAIPKETIVHIWISAWQLTMYAVTMSGKQALLSSCWYLDHLVSGGDWYDFYSCEPETFGGNEQQKKLIVGGEACMWSEAVNQYNVISRVWPRASATAEKLWSAFNVTDRTDASRRLEEHTCRMNTRGIGAQPPNSAGFCV